jgi:hypothetical protein
MQVAVVAVVTLAVEQEEQVAVVAQLEKTPLQQELLIQVVEVALLGIAHLLQPKAVQVL